MRAAILVCVFLASDTALAQQRSTSAPVEEAADPADETARRLFRAGKAAYEAGQYADALGYFEKALAQSGRPELHFNVGQAADRVRDDARALEAFRAYLAAVPNAENRVEVEARIAALERAVAERERAATSAAPTPEQTARAAQPSTAAHAAQQDDSEPVTEQWWFWTGLSAVVVGGAVVALALALGGDEEAHQDAYEGNGGSLRGP